jgi:YhcH/YjgK/YiaL family protein
MALFGNVPDLARVLAGDPRFRPGFHYLELCLTEGSEANMRLRGMAPDSVHEVALEAGSVSFDQVYRTRDRSDCFFESHRKYIDIQFLLEGEEAIDVLPIGALIVSKPYREEKDVIKYRDAPAGSRLRLRAGQAAIFFPEDGHMPGQFPAAPGLVRKTVVKVPI